MSEIVQQPLSEAALATRGSGIRLAAELGSRGFALATSILLAAGLGVQAFGVFAAVSGVAVILSELGELGLQQTASRALVAGTFSLRAMVRARAVLFLLLLGVAGVSPLLARPQWSDVLAPLVLFFGISGWSEYVGVALRARGHRVAEALVLLALRACTLATVAVAVSRKVSLAGVAWAHVIASLPPLVIAVLLIARTQPPEVAEGHAAADQSIPAVLRASLPLAINGGLALVALRIELLVIFWARGSWEAGLFGAAIKIVEALNGVPAAIAAGAMPALTREALVLCAPGVDPVAPHWGLSAASRLRPQTPKAARGNLVRRRTAATAALLAVPAATGLCLLAPGVLRFLGQDYVAAAPALRVVAFAVVALYMNAVLLHALIAAGRASWLPRLTAIRVGFAAVVALAAIPRFGFVAGAWGVLAAELLLLVLSARACRLADFAVPLLGPLAVAVAATVPMAAAVLLLDGGAIAGAAIGAAVYAATIGLAWALMREPLLRVLGAGEAA